MTGRPRPGCRGGMLAWLYMVQLPGTWPGTSSSAGTSPRCQLLPKRLERGGERPGSAYHLPLTWLFMVDHQGQIQDTNVPLPAAQVHQHCELSPFHNPWRAVHQCAGQSAPFLPPISPCSACSPCWESAPPSLGLHHPVGLEVCGPVVGRNFGELHPQRLSAHHPG